MIGPLKITLNAARPGTLPLPPVEAVVGSASTLYIYGAPGVCTSLSVRLFDFDGVASDIAATAAGNCWVVTLPASARYGKITGGVTVIGAGRDETGAAREWILGVGDYWVYNTDGEIAGGEEYTAAAQLAAAAAQTAQGKAEDAQAAAEQAAREAEGAVESCVPDTCTINGKALSSDITLTASDVGAIGNTGEQLIDGSIKARDYLSAAQLIVGSASNGLIFSQDALFVYATLKFNGTTIGTYKFPKDESLANDNGNIARLLDIYAAVRQIAPDFTAKAYALNELCSYNGVIYRCKLGYTASSLSPKPNTDTTHWEVKKVSELFLPLTGGTLKPGYLALEDSTGYKRVLRCNGTGGDFYIDCYNNQGTLIGSVSVPSTNGNKQFAFTESPAFTGTPRAPTPTAGDDSTKVATTAFVKTAVDAVGTVKANSTAIAPAFGDTSAYTAGKYVTYNGNCYCAVVDVSAPASESTNPTPDQDIYDDTTTPATGHWELKDINSRLVPIEVLLGVESALSVINSGTEQIETLDERLTAAETAIYNILHGVSN